MQRFRPHMGTVEKVMGALLVLTGIAFLNLFDWFSITALGQWLIETFPALGQVEAWVTSDSLQQELRQRAP